MKRHNKKTLCFLSSSFAFNSLSLFPPAAAQAFFKKISFFCLPLSLTKEENNQKKSLFPPSLSFHSPLRRGKKLTRALSKKSALFVLPRRAASENHPFHPVGGNCSAKGNRKSEREKKDGEAHKKKGMEKRRKTPKSFFLTFFRVHESSSILHVSRSLSFSLKQTI